VRVLLDACVPRQLARHIPGHSVIAAVDLGWGDLDDAPLLDAMADRFDALVTVDRGLPREQNVAGRSFSIVVLRARTNRLTDLLPLIPALQEALANLSAGVAREVGLEP